MKGSNGSKDSNTTGESAGPPENVSRPARSKLLMLAAPGSSSSAASPPTGFAPFVTSSPSCQSFLLLLLLFL